MNEQEVCFAVVVKNREVARVGRSYIGHPEIKYDGRKTKWFDDSALLKKGGVRNGT